MPHEKQKLTQPKLPAVFQNRDFFQTPNYATKLLVPYIPKDIKIIWECACAVGKISTVLEESGYETLNSDIKIMWDNQDFVYNFITGVKGFMSSKKFDCIITNPPFSLKKEFYKRCVEFDVPFALLIPADYSGWIIDAIKDGAEKLIPSRRINFITPSGKTEETGGASNFHSMWLTKGFNLGKSEVFVDLTLEMKKDI